LAGRQRKAAHLKAMRKRKKWDKERVNLSTIPTYIFVGPIHQSMNISELA
jgi:hypothetical protein